MHGLATVALLLSAIGAQGETHAAASTPGPGASQSATWRVDVGGLVSREAWDFNGSTERLVGANLGVERRVWRDAVAVRGEVVALRVIQDGRDAWLGGFSLGARLRWGARRTRPFTDIAVGLSDATQTVPPGGTPFNYLAVIGAGVERPTGRVVLSAAARWVHVSNNGREGRHRNPDLQAVGAVVSVGWQR